MKIGIVNLKSSSELKNYNKRTEKIQEFYKKEVSTFDSTKYDKVSLIYLTVSDLLREASAAYQNGAFFATVAMCRSALEAAVYLSITRAKNLPKTFSGGEIDIDYNYVNKNWGQLVKTALNSNLIDKKLENRIERLRKKGNKAMHFAAISDKELSKGNIKQWLEEPEAFQAIKTAWEIFTKLLQNLEAAKTYVKEKDKDTKNRFIALVVLLVLPIITILIMYYVVNLAYSSIQIILESNIIWVDIADLIILLIVAITLFCFFVYLTQVIYKGAGPNERYLKMFFFLFAVGALGLSQNVNGPPQALYIALGAGALILYYQSILKEI